MGKCALIVAGASFVQLTGCAGLFLGMGTPGPYPTRLSPEISGVLEENSVPAPGIKVRVVNGAREENCSNYWRETTSDAKGRFFFPEKTSLEWGRPHGVWREWSLCVEEGARFLVAISLAEYSYAYRGAPAVSLACKLSNVSLAYQPKPCITPRYAYDSAPGACACQAKEIYSKDALR